MRPEPVRRPEMAATTYRAVEDAVIRVNLRIFGGFHPTEADKAPAGCRTLFMLGPDEPGFWDRVSRQPEFSDGKPDPLDRWSRRAVEPVADEVGATALFPFGGPPWLPFFSWALRTGRCWQSPVRLLVHDTAGLFVSFRAALAFSGEIDLPAANSASPCGSCAERPCLHSCPAGVLDGRGYDAEGCKAHVSGAEGGDCLERGCNVRRSCPVSISFGRSERQSRFHQLAFINL